MQQVRNEWNTRKSGQAKAPCTPSGLHVYDASHPAHSAAGSLNVQQVDVQYEEHGGIALTALVSTTARTNIISEKLAATNTAPRTGQL